MTTRVCIEEEKGINDGPVTNNEHTAEVDKQKETAAFNSNSNLGPRFTLPKNSGLSLNENYTLPKTTVPESPINSQESRSFENVEQVKQISNHVPLNQANSLARDVEITIPLCNLAEPRQQGPSKPPIPLTGNSSQTNNGVSAMQGKWIRLLQAQASSSSYLVGVDTFGLGKRVTDDNRSPPVLKNKRHQVSMESGTQSQILVEAISQPCQKQ